MKNRKNKRRRLPFLLILCLLAGIYALTFSTTGGAATYSAAAIEGVRGGNASSAADFAPKEEAAKEGETSDESIDREPQFQLTMLDVGQGLSLLMESDGEYAIYDGGGRERSSYVVSYLEHQNVDSLKYMFVSHYDEDHIAGLIGILHTTDVEQVICPDYEADSEIYASFMRTLEENGAEVVHPAVGDIFPLGNTSAQVLGPDSYDHDSNNNSIAVRISSGDFHCILTGDAEEEEETALLRSGLELDSDLYVAGHHGSASSSGTDLLRAVSPDYVFISAGTDNSYGHPAQETLRRIQDTGAQLFRSDSQGEVTCYTDGSEYWFSEEPTENWASGVLPLEIIPEAIDGEESGDASTVSRETGSEEDTTKEAALSYILNTNTHKFHYPDCKSVRQMKDKNKQEYTGTRSEIIDMGYAPCGNCNP